MNKENIKKVVLAYSGGLDTSIIIPWLKMNLKDLKKKPSKQVHPNSMSLT